MRKRAPGQLALDLDGAGAGRTATAPPYPAWACPRPSGRRHPLAEGAEPYPRESWPWPRCGRCGDPVRPDTDD